MSDQDALWPTGPKHSRLGIASFLTSIAAVVSFIGAIVIGVTHPEGVDPDTPAALWSGAVAILALTLGAVAIALGIAGLSQKKRKKFLVIWALVLSVLVVAVLGFLLVLGQSMPDA